MEDIKDAWLALLKDKYPDLYAFIDLSGHIGDKSNKYYLVYMAMRLLEMKRVLKDTGSIYLHCDNTMGHFLKLLMDVIFGHQNFRNEIVWHYEKWTAKSNAFQKNHDVIYFYSKNKDYFFEVINQITNNLRQKYDKGYLIGGGAGGNGLIVYNKELLKVQELINSGKYIVRYEDQKGKPLSDVWDIPFINPMAKERLGYPTQKPLALLERIIKASCPEGGVVLDPFCGCATTCVAAEKLGMEWVGIDISKKAFELVNIRLQNEVAKAGTLFPNTLIFREDIPDRTDIDTKKLAGKYKKEVKDRLYGKQHGNCAGCCQHFEHIHMEIDHILARAKGGSDNEDNLQLLCSYCNRVKGDGTMELLLAKLKEIRKAM